MHCRDPNWWKSLEDNDELDVKYPYESHGLAGKPSNRAKSAVLSCFLQFVDANCQPNGRPSDSYSPQFYFLSKFTRIVPPKKNDPKYDDVAKRSVISVFNNTQQLEGKDMVGDSTARGWLQQYRPKVAVHPQYTDYCDKCKRIQEDISRKQAIRKRLHQSGNATEEELQLNEETIEALHEEKRQHATDAANARDFYKKSIQKCQESWTEIQKLLSIPVTARTAQENARLATLKHTFTLVLSADYQQSKLIPFWGRSEQPSSTYYLQKVSNEIFGVVDHREEKKYIYIFDERISPKNTDHTISLLNSTIEHIQTEHPWISRVCVFLDNAASTNKNKYLFAWGMEIVTLSVLSFLRFSFMLAGHTKFAPDQLSSQIASSYNHSDVFTIDELKSLCQPYATCFIEDGTIIFTWRDVLGEKYSSLPGVRNLHDFLIVRPNPGKTVIMKVQEHCFNPHEEPTASPLHVISDTAVPTLLSYKQARAHRISEEKMAHMVQMYNSFVPLDRRPDFLPAFVPTASSAIPITSRSASPRNKSKCSTPGYNGTGHKTPKRWSEGHTTKAGCPRRSGN